MWFVYIVKCRDESFYTGITTDIIRRLSEHNSKKGAKSVRSKIPVSLVYIEQQLDQNKAARREREIKGWNRNKKIRLIMGLP
ncbi:hypothetical protein A2767_03990 [Candidatus Roizmanbacteria bacterium RIFCSPHIGHO2_01_FULL_35_10]|uniref:GIY-YIG domain-containing protein n=1 Tax=Candidatus Roizmanbacteria bacterium RIFCSPLOWO2_01_FULL_35_13 TaxID=1802055 RepID=A0A1F7I7H7_9BACT|nr:MAG: hypothetical protein A2767_03990 [Candidatus Roizmanbacteria bacterium RIFCSPHIGHO2_01_FULL_35_10]OGK39316.1 MAG: hypothetical protein A3A74_05080 [Candidatus Roizmanbacteria bacterium RIFCSPLOWO2_01_FULL_35_13]